METIKELRQKYPQYSDMNDNEFADRFYNKYYSDIPREKFNEKIGLKNINPSPESNNIPKQGLLERAGNLAEKYINKPIQENFVNPANETSSGIMQGAQNFGIGAANLLPGVNMKRANWAPNTPAAHHGETAAEIGSYFIPGMGLGLGLTRAAKAIPMIGNAIKKMTQVAESKPIVNSIAKILGAGAEGATAGAIQNPEAQMQGAGEGGVMGGGINLISQLVKTGNPIFNALARAAGGAGIGYGLGGTQGAEYGAAGGLALPLVGKKLGIGQKPGRETLKHITADEVIPSINAAERLRTPITPAEASGNPFVGRQEGQFGRTGEAAAYKTKIGQERVEKQKNAISRLLNTIYDKSVASDNKIKELYRKSYQSNIDDETLNFLKKDPVIESAFSRVKKEPAYQKELSEIPENNYQYLDQVKRSLNDMEGEAKRAGEMQKADIIGNTRKDLQKLMKNINPDYGKATQEAQKKIVREKIEKTIRAGEIKGTNFYKKILQNDIKFDDLIKSLKNVPEAQEQLKDMKLAWKNLINIETPRAGAGKAETSMSEGRSTMQSLINMWHELTGSKYNKEAIKFINTPGWEKEFSRVSSITDKKKRADSMADLLGRLITAKSLSNVSQGSDKNGDHL